MQRSHPLLTFLLCIAALIVIGAVAWWVIKVVLGAVFYLIIGAAVVGGGIYLYGKAKRSLNGGNSTFGR